MAIKVIALKCPDCKSRLEGFESDRVFFCPACRTGWDFWSEPAGRYDLAYALPQKPPEKYLRIFYLPFYFFRIELDVSADRLALSKCKAVVERLDKLYVAAFRLLRESYFGEFGLIYTEASIVLEEDVNVPEAQRVSIGSAVRTLAETAPYVRNYPLGIIDKRCDVTNINVEVKADLEKIWAVPFYDLGEQIQEGILGRTFSVVALETIADFRE
jgi:hypothetical protein